MAEFRLETARLILRDWQDDDWDPFFRHTNTPEVMRWLGGLLDETMVMDVRRRLEAYRETHGHTFWVVERKHDGGHLAGELLGFCGLKKSNQEGGPQGEFEVGWRFRPDSWGQGYAREAAQASLAIAFERFSAPHVIALTVEENSPSWGLMLRLGMTRRKDLDFPNDDFGPPGTVVIAYSITREEWGQSKK